VAQSERLAGTELRFKSAMSNERKNRHSRRREPPSVQLRRIGSIETLEVLASDLAQLDSSIADEAQALGFFTFTAGILIGALLQLASLNSVTRAQEVLFGLAIAISCLFSIWFGLTWWRKRRERTSVRSRLSQGSQGFDDGKHS
jgi:hypothetical protein